MSGAIENGGRISMRWRNKKGKKNALMERKKKIRTRISFHMVNGGARINVWRCKKKYSSLYSLFPQTK